MRKFLHRFIPNHAAVKNNRWLKPFGHWLQAPNLWHLNRRSVAGGVAAGLFCGLIPGPLQMLGAALLSVSLRVNLPIALFVTLYTNPLTILPLYLLAYRTGIWVSDAENGRVTVQLALPQLHWHSGLAEWTGALEQLGKPLLIGLPLLAIGLAIAGYIAVRIIWRVVVILKWRARRRRHSV
ncbi:MAG: DUF2062 domain-containing protein [Gallionellales bacterium CG_4_8_14_3_um_filter_54_18]|nr:MAG: DUF2062 domain-containing protein [Gallionellales bacterium CG_4_8_14_3_um_filter_54_18]